MSDIKLHWDEFLTVWHELIAKDKREPGIQRLRLALGKGSIPRITAFKERAQLLRDVVASQSKTVLPDSISKAAHAFHCLIIEAAEENETLFMADIEEQRQEIEGELSDMASKVTESNKIITRQAKQLNMAASDTKNATDRIHELELELEKAHSATKLANSETENVTLLNIQLSKVAVMNETKSKDSLTAERNNTLDAKKQLALVQDEKNAAQEKHTTAIGELKQSHKDAMLSVKDEMTKMNTYYSEQLKTRENQMQALEKQRKADKEILSKLTQQLDATLAAHDQQKHLHATNALQISKLQDKETQLTVSLAAANESIMELKIEKKELHSIMNNIKKVAKG